MYKHRGNELIVDLNYPNASFLLEGKYDLVIDNGTLEHCFNAGEALINAARMVKQKGGFIFHINPLSMINHGFYNFCPTLLFDFYDQNDFKILLSSATGFKSMKSIKIDPIKRTKLDYYFGSEELIMNFIAMSSFDASKQKNRIFKYPIQSKYKHQLNS